MPDIPTNIAAVAESPNSIRVTWEDSDGTSYVVYGGISPTFGLSSIRGAAPAGQQALVVRGLNADTLYRFWVFALGQEPSISDVPVAVSATTEEASPADAMNVTAVRRAIHDFLLGATVLPDECIYWRDEDTLKGGKPFLLLHLAGPVKLGKSDFVQEQDQQGQREFTLVVEARSDEKEEAMQLALDVQAAFDDPLLVEVLDAQNIAVMAVDPAQDITVPLETKYEQRIRFEVTLHKAYNKTLALELIETAEINPA